MVIYLVDCTLEKEDIQIFHIIWITPISIKDIKFIVKIFSFTSYYTGECYLIFKERIMPILQKLFQKIEEREYFPNIKARH